VVVEKVLPQEMREKPQAEAKKSRLGELIDRVARRSSTGVRIEGIEDMLVHYARCCSPVKGDPIAGFVSRGRGLIVHRRDCPKILELDPERRISVSWDQSSTFARPIHLRVLTDDREGMLADLSGVFSKNSVSISEANCKVVGDGQAVNTFKCGITSLDQLRKIVKALEAVHDRGRGHGTGEANTAVVPKGNPRHNSQTQIVELAVAEGHRIEPERAGSAANRAADRPLQPVVSR
jgi:(p)ppGpp synthase/HD superfamily hydrolase